MRVLVERPTFSKRIFELYASKIMTADGAPISIQDGEELRLKYDDRDFQIRFGTDRFSVGNELYYEARLERQGHSPVAGDNLSGLAVRSAQ
jgi:hypothetical protein